MHPGGAAGVLCLGGWNIGRYAGNVLNSGSDGQVEMPVDLRHLPVNPNVAAQPGETWHFTYWFRDANSAGMTTSNFSDGVSIEVR